MKHTTIDKGIQDIRKVSLTEQEKSGILARVEKHAHIHTAPVARPVRSPFYTYGNFRFAMASLALVVLVGGTTVFASGQSLPGDVLYPVKIHVAEPLQYVLAVSPDAKERVEVDLVEERMKEAEVLAVQGRLVESVEVEIKEKVTERARKITKKMSKKNRDDLEVKISAHTGILNAIQKRAKKDHDMVVVEDNLATTTQNQDSSIDIKNRVEKKIKEARRKSKKDTDDTSDDSFETRIFDDASTTIHNIRTSEKNARKAEISVDRAIELRKVKRGK